MAQGRRGGWGRAAFTGLGALLCAGVIGCKDTDKPLPAKAGMNTKAATPGLPNTPMLPGSGSGGMSRTGTPGAPGGGFANPAAGLGSGGIQQTGGVGSYGSGGGAGYNTTGGRPPAGGYGSGTGTGGSGFGGTPGAGYGGSPAVPSVQPGAGYGAGAVPQPPPDTRYGSTNTGHSPPAVGLTDVGLVPPAPPGGGLAGPIAPPQSPPGANYTTGAFGAN